MYALIPYQLAFELAFPYQPYLYNLLVVVMILQNPLFLFVLLGILLCSVASAWLNKLTWIGASWAFVIATCIYLGVGFVGISMLGAFFIVSVWATRHKKELKIKLEDLANQDSKRKAGQVLANGGIAAILGFASFVFSAHTVILSLMVAASFSSALADTLSSELGILYGRNHINITNFKKDYKGRDGVISLEGTLIGILGSCLIGIVFCLFEGFYLQFLMIIVFSGTVGNLMDSILGATLERNQVLNNNMVNMLNTLTAALVAHCLYWILVY